MIAHSVPKYPLRKGNKSYSLFDLASDTTKKSVEKCSCTDKYTALFRFDREQIFGNLKPLLHRAE